MFRLWVIHSDKFVYSITCVNLKPSIRPCWDRRGETKRGPKHRIQLSFLKSSCCKSHFYSLQWGGWMIWAEKKTCKCFLVAQDSHPELTEVQKALKKKHFYQTQKATTIGKCSWSALVWNPRLSARASSGFTASVWNLALTLLLVNFYFGKGQVGVDRNFCE